MSHQKKSTTLFGEAVVAEVGDRQLGAQAEESKTRIANCRELYAPYRAVEEGAAEEFISFEFVSLVALKYRTGFLRHWCWGSFC